MNMILKFSLKESKSNSGAHYHYSSWSGNTEWPFSWSGKNDIYGIPYRNSKSGLNTISQSSVGRPGL